MVTVGITGGIGTGKSTVAKIFKQLNIPVFDSDLAGKEALEAQDVIDEISSNIGSNVVVENKIDRKKLAAIVFHNIDKLNTLNSIIHPKVGMMFNEFINNHKSTSQYIIKESAILIETKLYKKLDYLIVVTSPTELKISRVMKRNGISREEVESRISNQLPESDKVNLADFIIDNSGEVSVIKQVMSIHDDIIGAKK